MKNRTLGILVYLFYVLYQLLKTFRYMVSEEIDFKILRSDLLLRLCDDWCSHQNFSLTIDFTRLRLGRKIGVFGIIVQGSDFPKLALQNCK
jgi:hypothetical protein